MFTQTFDKAKEVTQTATNKLNESERFQTVKGHVVRGASATWEGTKVAAGRISEVSKKGWDKANENEKVAGALGKVQEKTSQAYGTVQDKTKEGWDKTKEFSKKTYGDAKDMSSKAYEKTASTLGDVSGKIQDRAAPIVDKSREVIGGAKRKGGEIWAAGNGMIVKVKGTVDELGWLGDPKQTLLNRQEAAEKWKAIKIRGAEEVRVGARKEYTTNYFVEQGTLVRWSFRVKDLDIGFGVRCRVMQDGGSREDDILGVEKFDNSDTIEGSWVADEDRTIVFVFDNTHSLIREKTVAYIVGVEVPESPADDSASADAAAASGEKAEL